MHSCASCEDLPETLADDDEGQFAHKRKAVCVVEPNFFGFGLRDG